MNKKALKILRCLENKGMVILFNSKVCKHWLKNHEDCMGCISEKGCTKFHRELLKIVPKRSNEE